MSVAQIEIAFFLFVMAFTGAALLLFQWRLRARPVSGETLSPSEEEEAPQLWPKLIRSMRFLGEVAAPDRQPESIRKSAHGGGLPFSGGIHSFSRHSDCGRRFVCPGGRLDRAVRPGEPWAGRGALHLLRRPGVSAAGKDSQGRMARRAPPSDHALPSRLTDGAFAWSPVSRWTPPWWSGP